ncbi:MAG: HAD family hydrolase [Muribaculaceae bacterium]
MENNQKMAVFAFDETLMRGESLHAFLKFASGNYFTYFLNDAIVLPWVMFHKIGLCGSAVYARKMVNTVLRGRTRTEISELCRDFASVINCRLFPKGIQELQKKRLQNYKVVIASEMVADIIRPWALKYGVNDVVANELAYDENDVYEGRFVSDIASGMDMGKRLSLKKLCLGASYVVAVSVRRRLMAFEQIATQYCLL